MRSLICFLLMLGLASGSFSQESKKKLQPNLATVLTMDGKKLKGVYYKSSEEEIMLLPQKTRSFDKKTLETLEASGKIYKVNIENISTLSLRKKNSVLKGALIGAGIGTLSGMIAGFVEGSDEVKPMTGNVLEDIIIAFDNSFAMTASQKAMAYGATFGIMGTITGIIIGTVAKKKFVINGRKENYRDKEAELMKRLLMK